MGGIFQIKIKNAAQNRICIFACNERKNIFGTDISKWALDALKRKIRVLNGSEKKILEKTEKIYILNNGGSITIFEFDFGIDIDEICSKRSRRSLIKLNNQGNVQSQ